MRPSPPLVGRVLSTRRGVDAMMACGCTTFISLPPDDEPAVGDADDGDGEDEAPPAICGLLRVVLEPPLSESIEKLRMTWHLTACAKIIDGSHDP